MINPFYNTLLVVLNHKQMGKITPMEFNSMLGQVLQKNYSELFADFRKLNLRKAKFQDTPNYGNEAFYMKQAQEYYITEEEVTLTDGKGTMPTDLYLVNSIFDEDVQYEKTDLKQFNTLKRLSAYEPTSCSPIFTYNGEKLKVYPAKDKVDVTYFRKAKLPKWTYTIVNGRELFNPDAPDYQDIDMHPIMLQKLFNDVCMMAGVHLQEQEVMQYAAQIKQEEIYNNN